MTYNPDIHGELYDLGIAHALASCGLAPLATERSQARMVTDEHPTRVSNATGYVGVHVSKGRYYAQWMENGKRASSRAQGTALAAAWVRALALGLSEPEVRQ